jgi:3-dehydroquinate dehydratase/shikimate dehydrogenase
MICISIAQESRRLALADMLNAGRFGDLLEVRLDFFGKSPDIGLILEAKPKPVIFSCRRPQDGGKWDGTEEERLAILRQCIIAKADYVEIELDVADRIPPFPPARRVISYTNLRETPADIAEIYAEAQTKKPDVIKLTTLARTPEEAWPLVQIAARAPVPTVVQGLGKPGLMLALLGKKIGAPWTYAALERGMESHPDQPTVHDLKDRYHYDAIERGTRLIGVTGFGPTETATTAALNAVLASQGLSVRCLPLGLGSVRLFRKVADILKLAGVVVDEEHRRAIVELVQHPAASMAKTGRADLLLHKQDAWHGSDTYFRALVSALEGALRRRYPDRPLQGRIVVLYGVTELGTLLAQELQQRGCGLIVASYDRNAAQQLAQSVGCRHLLPEAIYSTMHDAVVVCDEEKALARQRTGLQASGFKPGQVVMDLTAGHEPSALLREAAARGCGVVWPRDVWLQQTLLQAHLLTGRDADPAVIEKAVPPPDE